MSQFHVKAILYLLFLSSFITLGDCWSTVLSSACVTKSQRKPGNTPKTVTVTKTRYVQEISTVSLTATDFVAASTTTTKQKFTATVISYTATTTISNIYTYVNYSYVRGTFYVTQTVTAVVTAASATITVPTPAGFTPAASNPTTTAPPPIRVAVDVALTGTADIGRVVCTEKYILSTTVTTTVAAPVQTVTEYTEVATKTISKIKTKELFSQYTDYFYSYTYVGTETITYGFATSTITQTVSTTLNTATATSYAACANNNFISTVNSTVISGFKANQSPLELNTTDAHSCCVSCMQMDGCTGSIFYDADLNNYYDYYDNNCFLFTLEIGHKCRPAKKAGWAYYVSQYPYNNDKWTISNGQCGQGYFISQYY